MNTKVNEGKLISGKEAKKAWANGEELEFYSPDLDVWFGLNDEPFMSDVFEKRHIRLKARTTTINGIEVPAPFEPKEDCDVFILNDSRPSGYQSYEFDVTDTEAVFFGVWRTEEEIKQVVAVLRQVFGGSHE